MFHQTIIRPRYRAHSCTTHDFKEPNLTQEQRIYQYYRTGVECLNRGRRADAALMAAAIRCYDPTHRLAVALRAALAGERREHDDADDDTGAHIDSARSFIRWQ